MAPKEDFQVQLSLATTSAGQKEFKLLDSTIGFKCMASLLGVGTGRLRKGCNLVPDMRHGRREPTNKPGSWSVDGFLRMAYDSTAETLPDKFLSKDQTFFVCVFLFFHLSKDNHVLCSQLFLFVSASCSTSLCRFIRRGRASRQKTDLDSDGPSDWEEIASDIENTDEIRDWMSQTAEQSPFMPKQVLVRKYLPPGTVTSLYEEYKSTQQMLGGDYVSYLGRIALNVFHIVSCF